MSWKYETDDARPRAHYLVNIEALQRVDCRSEREANRLLAAFEAGDWFDSEQAEDTLRKFRGLKPTGAEDDCTRE